MVQLILISCLGLLAFVPCVLVVSLVRFLMYRSDARRLLMSASFLAGFLAVAWAVWLAAMPEGWTLSVWATLRASVDSETYGHTTEHAAEVLASKALILGVCGALMTAGLAWVATRTWKSSDPTSVAV